jgi:2-methylisocitrate lyase-like PEP mutase family enzyme
MSGKQVIPADEMAGKVRAAVAARRSRDFVVIARTDARAVEGIDAAIARARQYYQAGADMLFVEAPQSEQEIELIARRLSGVPLLFNWAEGGKTPPVPIELLRSLGYRLVIFPVGALLAATSAIRQILEILRRDGTPIEAMQHMTPFPEFLDFIGLPEIDELGKRFA